MDPQNCNFESLAHVFFLFLSISDSKHVAEWSSEGHSLHEWMPSDTPAGFLESMESAFRNSRCFILAFTMLYESWRRLICGLVCFKRNWTQPSMILIITLCLYRKKHISGWWFNNPSEKYELVSWDDDIHKSHVPNHQPDFNEYLHGIRHITCCHVGPDHPWWGRWVLIMRASNEVFYIRCPEEDVWYIYISVQLPGYGESGCILYNRISSLWYNMIQYDIIWYIIIWYDMDMYVYMCICICIYIYYTVCVSILVIGAPQNHAATTAPAAEIARFSPPGSFPQSSSALRPLQGPACNVYRWIWRSSTKKRGWFHRWFSKGRSMDSSSRWRSKNPCFRVEFRNSNEP